MLKSEDFRKVREHDTATLGLENDDSLMRWEWAHAHHAYNGPEDLLRWFQWLKPYQHYFHPEQIGSLAWRSETKNREIFAKFGWSYDFSYVDEYSATDYLLQNLYPVPERMRVRRVLDFGAGFGRQANLWTQLNPEMTFVGMDGIEGPYCLQNLYYHQLDAPLHDYMDAPDSFAIEPTAGIYHLPTWRTDLLPESFFDMVVCVQVIPEINEQLVLHMLDVFHKSLKPGGALFIRDHDLAWQPAHTLNLKEILPKIGFELEFSPYVADTHPALYSGHAFPPDIHGIPRIWRKRDSQYWRAGTR
jgi:SAM-dependent methyltransferase